MRRGTNQTSVGTYNQVLVLDLIRRSHGGLSRVGLAEGTRLSAQTITNVTRRLLDDGLIREAGKQISGPGKPPTNLTLIPDARFAVGIHLDPSVITAVLINLEGEVVDRVVSRVPAGARPDDTFEEMQRTVDAIVDRSGVDRRNVMGVGVAAPGPIDAGRGTLIAPPMLTLWRDVPLRDDLARAVGLPVLLEKDVVAGAVGEQWLAREGARDDFLFLYYGTGVGLGVAVGGEITRGSTGNAGDIGHVVVDPDGVRCWCGKRGCLGDSISPARLSAEAVESGVLPADTSLADYDAVDDAFSRLAERQRGGDPGASAIFDRAGQRIGRALVVLLNLLDPDTVVFGGPFWSRIAPVALRSVEDTVTSDPALLLRQPLRWVDSTLGDDIIAIGAACLVLDDSFAPRSSGLLIPN